MLQHKLCALVVTASLFLGTSRSVAQSPDGKAGREAARPIAAAAIAAYDARQYVIAITGFEQADALYPTPQYRIYIARANKWLGKVASAARAYEAVMSLTPGPDAPRDFASVQSTAASELAEIRPRIPTVAVQIAGAQGQQLRVTIDGEAVPGHLLERMEVDPGEHTIQASAPGFTPASTHLQIAESTFTRVSLKLEPEAVAPMRPVLVTPGIPSGQPANPDERETSPKENAPPYSHRWRPGIVLRGDIDPVGGGVLVAPGLSFGLFDHLEIGVSALIGRDAGIEPMARAFVLSGSWKPLIEVAVPIFIVDGGRPGIRAAAGLQWDFSSHLGVFAEVGGAYFPDPPPHYETGYFLPSIGLQGRL